MDREERFISELNRKKERAWQDLYTDFYPALCSYARRIVENEQIAEDVVQECLIALWDTPLKFPNIRALVAYLYRSVYHRSLNVIRDRTSAQKALDEFSHTQPEIPEEETLIGWAIEETVVTRFRIVMKDLSPQQQQVLTLSMQGKKVSEIALQLGISENTVKMQKKRAYAEVRERMGNVVSILFMSFFKNIF